MRDPARAVVLIGMVAVVHVNADNGVVHAVGVEDGAFLTGYLR